MNLHDAIGTIDISFGTRVKSVTGIEGTIIDINQFIYRLFPSFEPRPAFEILWDNWEIGFISGEVLKSIELTDI